MRPSSALARRWVVPGLLASLAVLPACGQGGESAPGPAPGSETSAEADRARDGEGQSGGGGDPSPASRPPAPDARAGFPALAAWRQVRDLSQPWDVAVLPGLGLLVDERETGRLYVARGSAKQRVAFPSGQVWASGETGLMGLAVDPRFRRNRRFYTCHGGFAGGGERDVRVDAWRLSGDATRTTRSRILLRGIEATSGRHGGCRLLIARNGALLVGTGDAAVGSNAQDKTALGGKVLRLNRWNGRPWPGNRWPQARSVKRRYVFTYGHRNVQGLAQRWDGSLWSAEHGPDRNDEVNKLFTGANYGWDPRPGYDESVPMTDFRLPGPQVGARWRSGKPTLATSGATFVRGRKWGAYRDTLAVAALKAERVVFMRFDRRGRLQWTRTPAALRRFGRLRSITRAPNNDLLITTANGSGDAVVRVRPRG